MHSLLFFATCPFVAGHFTMVWPPNWHDEWALVAGTWGKQCNAGCTGRHAPGEVEPAQACSCEWYTNWTFVKTPTIPQDSPLRTYQDTDAEGKPIGDWTCKANGGCRPWRAPGQAPVSSPCGVDGGNAQGCPAGNPSPSGCAGGGYGYGPDARKVKFNGVVTTRWKAGAIVTPHWAITANHGGGYSYRLCPKPADGKEFLTEECFQKIVLNATGDHQARFPNKTTQTFPAMRTTTGTFPPGSQWTRNPIPACKGPYGGSDAGGGTCTGYQFPPPLGPDAVPNEMGGFGNHGGNPRDVFMWHVADQVQVPADLAAGPYVLSLRWDCEQTPQVWFTCADIEITRSDDVLV